MRADRYFTGFNPYLNPLLNAFEIGSIPAFLQPAGIFRQEAHLDDSYFMLYSMTGFGRAEATVGGRQVVVELRSLNGKSFELNTARLQPGLRQWEPELRTLLSKRLVRGTADLLISLRADGSGKGAGVNLALAESYYQSISELARRLELPQTDILGTLLRMPDVLSTESEALTDEDWAQIRGLVEEAADKLVRHRGNEGVSLEADLLERMGAIEAAVTLVVPLEPGRMDRIRERLQAAQEATGAVSKDPNRFEQELIYYLEKIDISEEKTRLAEHIRYFRETVQNGEASKGKVLGFILQEIGREINTMGSKANDAAIQQLVVTMKDELEKAKEQVLNAL